MRDFIEYLESIQNAGEKPRNIKPNYRILYDARYIHGHNCFKCPKGGTVVIDKGHYNEFLHADGTRTNDL